GQKAAEVSEGTLQDETFRTVLGDHFFEQLREDSELLDIASTEFDQQLVSKGELTPVFFGSALTNFGVEPFLSHFL
ncbi:peptide chain release factor 3, partial [Desulfovibrio desulfuricans]|nr:peptide chain release factor 3 [Desulfovibrio desulfuricans]